MPHGGKRRGVGRKLSSLTRKSRAIADRFRRLIFRVAQVFLDDLKQEALYRMKESGFTPGVVVETSPGNFQAWLNHGCVLSRRVSSAAARALAEQFGGDLGSADWRHYGRLAGFTNRKEKHRQEDGRFPFVRLIHAGGEVYPNARRIAGISGG